MTIDDLLALVKNYNNSEDDLNLIRRAYEYADLMITP